MDFYSDRPVLIIDSIRKKNQPVCMIGPVRIIETKEALLNHFIQVFGGILERIFV